VYDGNFDDDHIHGPGVFFAESGIILKNQTWEKGNCGGHKSTNPLMN
jgi:hypothetical protein